MERIKEPARNKLTTQVQAASKSKGISIIPPSYGLSFVDAKPIQKKENKTGLPDYLKSGVESLSGIDMSDVKVHYNSSQPAQLNAHAYAQGNQIHIAPGQEKHLPHEAWHVVQQKQGRVRPTKQLKGKVNINDDKGLEKEADVMGDKALHNTKTVSESTHQLQLQKMMDKSHITNENNYSPIISTTLQLVSDEQVETSIRNVKAYSPDTYQRYGDATIRAVLRANDIVVRGHASGAGGDAQNAATTADLQVLTEALRSYVPPAAVASDLVLNVDLRHNTEQKNESKAKKDKDKADKKARKKATYDEASRKNFGKRPPKGGGGTGSVSQKKSFFPIRIANEGIIQRTNYDDEIGTLVWTSEFDRKHFAQTIDEAVNRGIDRIRQSAFKEKGARPDSNTVIIYDKELLFFLKEEILHNRITGRFSFTALVAVDVSAQGVTLINGATFYVDVNEKGEICHLSSVNGGKLTAYEAKRESTKFE